MAKTGPKHTDKKPNFGEKILAAAVDVAGDTLHNKILGIAESPVHSDEYKLRMILALLK